MSKDDREARLVRGRQLLRDANVGDDAGAPALAAVIGRDPASDLAIAERLGASAHAESAELLLRLESDTQDKLVRKEARRSLHRLQQKGIAVERSQAAPPSPLPSSPALEVMISPVDGAGEQMIWLEKRTAGGGSDYIFAFVNDPEGVRDLELFHASRKELRAAREKMRRENEIELISVPDWRYYDFVIDRAWRWSEQAGKRPADYPRMRAHLTTEPVTKREHPVFAIIDRDAVRADESLVASSAELLKEKEFRTWFFGAEQLEHYAEIFRQIRDSPLVLNEAQQRERIGELIEDAVEKIFGGEQAASWARRLTEMAYFLHHTKRPELARCALAAALALASSTQGGRGIGICEAIARRSLAVLFQMAEQKDQETSRSSLVLTPGQALRESAERRQR